MGRQCNVCYLTRNLYVVERHLCFENHATCDKFLLLLHINPFVTNQKKVKSGVLHTFDLLKFIIIISVQAAPAAPTVVAEGEGAVWALGSVQSVHIAVYYHRILMIIQFY